MHPKPSPFPWITGASPFLLLLPLNVLILLSIYSQKNYCYPHERNMAKACRWAGERWVSWWISAEFLQNFFLKLLQDIRPLDELVRDRSRTPMTGTGCKGAASWAVFQHRAGNNRPSWRPLSCPVPMLSLSSAERFAPCSRVIIRENRDLVRAKGGANVGNSLCAKESPSWRQQKPRHLTCPFDLLKTITIASAGSGRYRGATNSGQHRLMPELDTMARRWRYTPTHPHCCFAASASFHFVSLSSLYPPKHNLFQGCCSNGYDNSKKSASKTPRRMTSFETRSRSLEQPWTADSWHD